MAAGHKHLKPDISRVCIGPKGSLKEVLAKLSLNKPNKTQILGGIVLIVDKDQKLMGVATDGDIRRALAGGATVETAISEVMNTQPFLVEAGQTNMEILSLVADKIRREHWHKDRLNKIVIVDGQNRPVNLISFYDLWQASDVRFKHIGVIGLGYVGLTLSLTLADLGFKVKGLDINAAVTDSLRRGRPHFFEVGLEALLKDHLNKNFQVVDNFVDGNNCDIYFVTVGTPLDKKNKPDLRYLRIAAAGLSKVLKYGDAVILRSTVPVGTTRNVVMPILEKFSGLKGGEGFLVAFAPERTVQGKALEELRQLPQVIGGLNRASCDLASSIFSFMTNTTALVDSLEEAEMVKLVNNTYRDVTFAFANEVSLIARKWGINTKKVIEAANYGYERSNVPMPSPGVGGYCLEKDPFIFIESARARNYEPLLATHSRKVSYRMLDFVAGDVFAFLKEHKKSIRNPKILILGLAFKGRPVTSDVRGSSALELSRRLQAKNYGNIYGYDPAVRPVDVDGEGIKYISDLKSGFAKADAVVVMNNHPEFDSINIRRLLDLARKPVMLFDSWAIYSPEEIMKVKGIHYLRL